MPAKTAKLLNRSLMHSAAKLYYIEGVSQLNVAERLQVSTASVSRLLAGAREEGIVRFVVKDLDESDDLGDALCTVLGLKSARVVDADQPAALASQVGILLEKADLTTRPVLAIGWGRTMQSVINVGLPKLPGIQIVPTTGGMLQTESHFQINEFVRIATEQTQGKPNFLYVPSIVSPELRNEILRDETTARTIGLWNQLGAAVLGVGDYHHATTMRDIDVLPDGDSEIVGDVVRHYFGEDGMVRDWPSYKNLVSISADQLRRTPLSIAVAVGKGKAQSIIGAARSGMINALVTDVRTARAILDRLEA